MAYVITDSCIDVNDRSCVEVCPVDCIYEAGRMLVIEPDECIDCGACEPACPVEAIVADDALSPEHDVFVHFSAAYAEHGAATVADMVEEYARANPLPPIAGYRG